MSLFPLTILDQRRPTLDDLDVLLAPNAPLFALVDNNTQVKARKTYEQ